MRNVVAIGNIPQIRLRSYGSRVLSAKWETLTPSSSGAIASENVKTGITRVYQIERIVPIVV